MHLHCSQVGNARVRMHLRASCTLLRGDHTSLTNNKVLLFLSLIGPKALPPKPAGANELRRGGKFPVFLHGSPAATALGRKAIGAAMCMETLCLFGRQNLLLDY